MRTLPKSEPESKSTNTTNLSVNVLIGEKLPIVHTLSGILLEKHGWLHFGRNTMVKGEDKIFYDGVEWILNGDRKIQFLEDINSTEENQDL